MKRARLRILWLLVVVSMAKCQDCGEFYRYPSKGN